MADYVMRCKTCKVSFADVKEGRDHVRSEQHHYNIKREAVNMKPVRPTANVLKKEMAPNHKTEESGNFFCKVYEKPFRSNSCLQSHLLSNKYQQMEAISKNHGIQGPEIVTQSTGKTKKSKKDSIRLEECLFCSHISSSLETNLHHMSEVHSFFLPEAEYISDLEGLVVCLGEMISQDHMCIWCHERSKMFREIADVQKHMLDKGHCKMKHDETSWGSFSNFYDYRSCYPEEDNTTKKDEIVDQGKLVSSGYFMVLPSGIKIGHRDLNRYYKQNHGRKKVVAQTKTSKTLAGSGNKSLGWTGCKGAAEKLCVRDIRYAQRQYNLQRITSNKSQKREFPKQTLGGRFHVLL